ncbi:DUF3617 domain-containing protein [Hansschlegelia plantiphila]|uniref:DUF3617 family protein n=1 Tax=Hansschlegelia plantiphila TaxID=374655 RepID=A0A9W6IZR9_9HYPH|nr:DUF3617 family protein [Hansschlegelia plantiphila]GLK67083.1 hypothetical protein GCM10008179_07210 [Hansschlegelia plantiphila]
MRRLAILLPVLFVTPVLADGGFHLPPRKPGQWEMKIQVDTAAMPPQIISMCLDAESDKLLNDRFGGMASSMCSKQEQRNEGDAIILDSECKLGGMSSSSHSVVTGDFNDAYTMKTSIKMSGQRDGPQNVDKVAPQGPDTQETTIEAKRTGDCTAGAKPGDIDFGGGRTINVRDMPAPTIQ